MNISDKVFPIYLNKPITVEFDPNTGLLLLSAYQLLSDRSSVRVQAQIEPKAVKELLSSLSYLQKEYGEIIEEKAKESSLQ